MFKTFKFYVFYVLLTVRLGMILLTVHLGMILLTVHLGMILVNDHLNAQFFFSYMFIPNLYMFRALMCSSSGELYQYDIWYMSLCVGDLHIRRSPTYSDIYQISY